MIIIIILLLLLFLYGLNIFYLFLYNEINFRYFKPSRCEMIVSYLD